MRMVLCADALVALKTIESNSVDSIVTDPPAGISFMGKKWDDDKGGRNHWIAWLAEIMRECLRVLKPGGHAVVWALPRTSHWTATGIEDAGFEIREVGIHMYGSGFPKSLNVSKAIDAAAGAVREVVGVRTDGRGRSPQKLNNHGEGDTGIGHADGSKSTYEDTIAASDAAKQWDGFGTALKPAAEHWIIARKPLESTVAGNVLKWGTGAINIDGCRIAGGERPAREPAGREGAVYGAGLEGSRAVEDTSIGRWPANVTLSHLEECQQIGTRSVKANGHFPAARGVGSQVCGQSGHVGQDGLDEKSMDGEVVESWACAEGCPVRMLDAQAGSDCGAKAQASGPTRSGASSSSSRNHFAGTGEDEAPFHADAGGPSRFYYVAKPGKRECEAGLEGFPIRSGGELTDREDGTDGLKSPRAGAGRGGGRANHHPTKKGVALMRWLCRLVTPPGGLVLDPFTGSGTTGCAAALEGFDFFGIEKDPEYVKIAVARIRHWEKEAEKLKAA